MTSVLVTGATGMIGRALCAQLAKRGYNVTIAVRRRLDLSRQVNVRVVEVGDIGSHTDWIAALNGVDGVIHLAARVHMMRDEALEPLIQYRQVNVLGTEALARAAASTGVKRFIYLSSIKVNGEATSTTIPFSEKDAAHPLDSYATSKLEAEQCLQKISSVTGMEVVILRPPLVYGPGVKANFLRLLRWVDKGIPLPLSTVKNQRSLVYLGNLVDALITSIEHPAAGGNTYLVSDGVDVSTPELIRSIATAMGKSALLWPCPESVLRVAAGLVGKSAEADRLFGSMRIDITKIRRELHWTPPYSLQSGIQETVAWFMNEKLNRII